MPSGNLHRSSEHVRQSELDLAAGTAGRDQAERRIGESIRREVEDLMIEDVESLGPESKRVPLRDAERLMDSRIVGERAGSKECVVPEISVLTIVKRRLVIECGGVEPEQGIGVADVRIRSGNDVRPVSGGPLVAHQIQS